MSFILDALKKSESDRQRQSGPALYEVKVAAPRSQLPLWAIGLAALLAVNLVIVAWALLRRPAHPKAPETSVVALTSPSAPPPVATPPAAPAAAPAAATTAPAASITAPAPVPAPAQGTMALGTPPAPANGPAPAVQPLSPDDYEPAAEPSAAAPVTGFHVRRTTDAGVPLYSQAAASGAPLPELRLDLHVYAARPEERFVMINMKKLHEGDSLPEGVRVESITPEGAVLSHNGSRFLLPRE
jgi:general secretion pathway protein B